MIIAFSIVIIFTMFKEAYEVSSPPRSPRIGLFQT